jgi:hypothetical protein
MNRYRGAQREQLRNLARLLRAQQRVLVEVSEALLD